MIKVVFKKYGLSGLRDIRFISVGPIVAIDYPHPTDFESLQHFVRKLVP